MTYPGDKHKKCQTCDLPKVACACADAKAHDAYWKERPRWKGDLREKGDC